VSWFWPVLIFALAIYLCTPVHRGSYRPRLSGAASPTARPRETGRSDEMHSAAPLNPGSTRAVSPDTPVDDPAAGGPISAGGSPGGADPTHQAAVARPATNKQRMVL
jgi:hypothetical protein